MGGFLRHDGSPAVIPNRRTSAISPLWTQTMKSLSIGPSFRVGPMFVCGLWGNLRRVSVFAFLALYQGLNFLIFTHFLARICDVQSLTMPPPNPSANLGLKGVASVALFS